MISFNLTPVKVVLNSGPVKRFGWLALTRKQRGRALQRAIDYANLHGHCTIEIYAGKFKTHGITIWACHIYIQGHNSRLIAER